MALSGKVVGEQYLYTKRISIPDHFKRPMGEEGGSAMHEGSVQENVGSLNDTSFGADVSGLLNSDRGRRQEDGKLSINRN